MRRWKNICCAIDLSALSRVAMEDAAALANRSQAKLTLVHVRPPSGYENSVLSATKLAGPSVHERAERLERWRSDAETLAGNPVGSSVLTGEPAAEIVRHARKERCDLVVIGTHGRTGIRRLVLGSVAEHVVRHSHCPVLVVRDHRVLEAEDTEADEISWYA